MHATLLRSHAGDARRQRGAALLMALAIVALIVTASVSSVWQQWRAVQVEAGERERARSAWLLEGLFAWAQQVLDDDARAGGPDHLGEPWAQPLAEVRVSRWLATGAGAGAGAGGPAEAVEPVFLSGRISDLQARYNLRNLVRGSTLQSDELERLAQLCRSVGVDSAWAERLGTALNAALVRAATRTTFDAPLLPSSVAQLDWLGIDADSARRLAPHVVLLPVRTPVNVNTASAEVLRAAISGLDRAAAAHLIALRERRPFASLQEIEQALPELAPLDAQQVGVSSQHFEVLGRLRVGEHGFEQRARVARRDGRAQLVQRDAGVASLRP